MKKGKTENYRPRFKNRPHEVVEHASLVARLDPWSASIISAVFGKIIDDANLRKHPDLHLVGENELHLTYLWMSPGADAVSDQKQIKLACDQRAKLMKIASRMKPITLEAAGLVLRSNQIMITFKEEGWNEYLNTVKTLRDALGFDGGYDATKGPLDMGPIPQVTMAMFLGAVPIKRFADAIEPYLAKPDTKFPPIKVEIDGAELIKHIFHDEVVIGRGETFVSAHFGQSQSREAEQSGPDIAFTQVHASL